MTALQVRDFPAELYEELRAYANANHRSMAQQTIAAVAQMIHGGNEKPVTPCAVDASRMVKREEILRRAQARRQRRRDVVPSPEEMLREARDERDRVIDALLQESLGGER